MILFNRFKHINYSNLDPNDFYQGYFDFHVCFLQIQPRFFRIHSRQSLLRDTVALYGQSTDNKDINYYPIILTKDNLEDMIAKYVFPEINKIIQRQKRINETVEFFDKISVML